MVTVQVRNLALALLNHFEKLFAFLGKEGVEPAAHRYSHLPHAESRPA